MFAESFRRSGYEVRALSELGPHFRDVHYTHAIESFFREGGGAPPVWARANGVDSVVLGITFMEELLGVFVRTDDPRPQRCRSRGAAPRIAGVAPAGVQLLEVCGAEGAALRPRGPRVAR